MQINPIFKYFDMLTIARKSYGKMFEPLCREQNLTRNELDVLLFLYNNPGYDRAADIVAHRGIAKSHVSLSVNNLEQKQLLQRRFDPEDRRTAHLELTEAGTIIAASARTLQERFFSGLYQGVTEEEFALWQSFSKRVFENMRQMDVFLTEIEAGNE